MAIEIGAPVIVTLLVYLLNGFANKLRKGRHNDKS